MAVNDFDDFRLELMADAGRVSPKMLPAIYRSNRARVIRIGNGCYGFRNRWAYGGMPMGQLVWHDSRGST